MYTDDDPAVESIEQKIRAAIDLDADDDLNHVFTALAHVFSFYMAVACADCRKNIARKLRKRIPEM